MDRKQKEDYAKQILEVMAAWEIDQNAAYDICFIMGHTIRYDGYPANPLKGTGYKAEGLHNANAPKSETNKTLPGLPGGDNIH